MRAVRLAGEVGKAHLDAAMGRGTGAILVTLASRLWGVRMTWVGRPVPGPGLYRRIPMLDTLRRP